jgi:enoyl-CoA hydratase/carnithine racemase
MIKAVTLIEFFYYRIIAYYNSSGCATVTMQNPPVNAMSLEMMQTLTKTLIELESNKCKGLVFTSVIL